MDEAGKAIESYRFNVAVAKTMELVNAARKAIDSGPGAADPAVREAVEAVAVLLSVVAPYTRRDMWARLGHHPSVARAAGRRLTRRCSCARGPAWCRWQERCADA